MTLVDDLKPVINEIRAIPGQLGLRPNRVYINAGTWSGTYPGEGTETQTDTELTVGDGQPPKVRLLNDEQRALGELDAGAIEVGPITPDHTGGGVSAATLLAQSVTAGNTRTIKTVGPAGTTHYVVKSVFTDKALHYRFQAEPVGKE